MLEAYHLGGWGMYPTTLMGILLLIGAVYYARKPEKRYLPVVVSLSVLTFLSGTLGFVTGVIKSIQSATNGTFEGNPQDITLEGVGESLNNVGLALVLLVLATILVTVGTLKASRKTA
jgi:hypothetical protein